MFISNTVIVTMNLTTLQRKQFFSKLKAVISTT